MQAREQGLDMSVAGRERRVGRPALQHTLARDVEVRAHLPLRALGQLLVGARRRDAGAAEQAVEDERRDRHAGGVAVAAAPAFLQCVMYCFIR